MIDITQKDEVHYIIHSKTSLLVIKMKSSKKVSNIYYMRVESYTFSKTLYGK